MNQPTADTALFLDSLPVNPIPFYRAAEEHLQMLQEAGVRDIDDMTKRILWVPAYIDKGQLAKVDLAELATTWVFEKDMEGPPPDPVRLARYLCHKAQTEKEAINFLINTVWGIEGTLDMPDEWKRLRIAYTS